MTNPRVFIVQRPTQRDPGTGAVVPSMDLSPANEWGEVVFLLRDNENPFNNVQSTVLEIERVMDDRGYDPEGRGDWILLVGNPILIGLVSAVAAGFNVRLRLLQWSRADRAYRPVEAQLSQ